MLTVVIPYRDREAHLIKWLNIVPNYLQANLNNEFQVAIIKQNNTHMFNQARLGNSAVRLFKTDYYCFHDVDMYPLNADYSFNKGFTHLVYYCDDPHKRFKNGQLPANSSYWGGVFLIDKESFYKINGYAINMWGWGGEDDDLHRRCITYKVPVARRQCKFNIPIHKKTKPPDKSNLENNRKILKNPDYKNNGIRQMPALVYNVDLVKSDYPQIYFCEVTWKDCI